MQTRTLLGAAATASAMAWSVLLISDWCNYTLQSARAEIDMYLGEAQRAALASAFYILTINSLLAGLLLSTGILLLTASAPDSEFAGPVTENADFEFAPRHWLDPQEADKPIRIKFRQSDAPTYPPHPF